MRTSVKVCERTSRIARQSGSTELVYTSIGGVHSYALNKHI